MSENHYKPNSWNTTPDRKIEDRIWWWRGADGESCLLTIFWKEGKYYLTHDHVDINDDGEWEKDLGGPFDTLDEAKVVYKIRMATHGEEL